MSGDLDWIGCSHDGVVFLVSFLVCVFCEELCLYGCVRVCVFVRVFGNGDCVWEVPSGTRKFGHGHGFSCLSYFVKSKSKNYALLCKRVFAKSL